VGEHVRSFGREQERLAARASAEVEHGLAGPRLNEEAEELAAFVLQLEEAVAPGPRAEKVRLRRLDQQSVGRQRAGAGGDAFPVEGCGEALATAEQAVGAQADRAGDGDGGAEGFCLGAELGEEELLEPVGQ